MVDKADMRVVHCYGQTPAMAEAIALFYEQLNNQPQAEKPDYDRYEEERAWQPTVCGLRQASADVLRPSDFVAVVNYTNPDIDMDALFESGEYEALPYQDGSFTPNANPCGPCKEAAPFSWPFLFYAGEGSGSVTPEALEL